MDTLKSLTLGLGRLQELLVAILGQHRVDEQPLVVFLLHLRPLAVMVVQSGPIGINVLINVALSELFKPAAAVHHVLTPVSKEVREQEDHPGHGEGPLVANPSLPIEEGEPVVIGQRHVRGVGHGLQMIVREQLLVGGHPVAEGQVDERCGLQLIQHVLGQALVVHRWQTVSVEE